MLWFTFLLLSTAAAIYESVREPVYFPEGRSLFPEWPVWRPDWAIALAGVTAAILFLPKILAIVLALGRGEARQYGGAGKLFASVVFETLLSSLLAPIRMVFHTRFVLTNLTGYTVVWRSQTRGDAETSWGEAVRHHGVDTIVACGWAALVGWLNPHYAWWLTPVVAALILAIPVSVWTSRVRPGRRARKRGLLLIPEETNPPREILDVQRDVEIAEEQAIMLPEWRRDGFVRAVVDPLHNAVHCALIGSGRSFADLLRRHHAELVQRGVRKGPQALGASERRRLLRDPEAMLTLHRVVWELADRERAAAWGLSR
jgi:membrane glycosyltransferase